MTLLSSLFWADILGLRTWLRHSAISKVTVILLFLLLGCGISYGLFRISSGFFGLLAGFEAFGAMTAKYCIHAALILCLWILLMSSIASYSGLLLIPGNDLTYLLTQPYVSRVVGLWLTIKACIGNTFLLYIIFLPVLSGYGWIAGVPAFRFWVLSILAITFVSFITTVIGSFLATLLLPYILKKTVYWSIGGVLLFFLGLVGMLKSIFPHSMFRLYDASPEQFLEIYSQLPLNNPILPTYWIANVFSGTVTFQTVCILTSIVALGGMIVTYIRIHTPVTIVRLRSRKSIVRASFKADHLFLDVQYPIVLKDTIRLLRDTKESGYAVFLGSVVVFFFISLSMLSRQLRGREWQSEFLLFSFSWILFFSIAFLLRFVFPGMITEGKSVWHLFTSPVTVSRIIREKLFFSLIIAVILCMMATGIWSIIPFARPFLGILMPITFVPVIVMAFIHVLSGAQMHDFRNAYDAEKASTSIQGLSALALSFISGGAGVYVMNAGLTESSRFTVLVTLLLCLYVGMLLFLYGAMKTISARYELE